MRHVNHLITRYVHGQLRMAKRAEVINHVRECPDCRAILAREERLAADLRREMPLIGGIGAGQLSNVWAGVWSEFNGPRPRHSRFSGQGWMPGLSAVLAVLLLVALALPVMAHEGMTVQAAEPHQALAHTVVPASPTPEGTDDAAKLAAAADRQQNPVVFYGLSASPVPMPGATVSPSWSEKQCQATC